MTSHKLKILIAGICVCLGAHLAVAQVPLVFTNLQIDGSGVVISWSGGTGPYLLQRKNSLADSNWLNLTATTQLRAVMPKDTDAAFYQLTDHTTRTNSTNSVLALSARLTGAAVRPTPLTNSGAGFGSFYLDGNRLAYQISYRGLSSSPTTIIVHGPATSSQTANTLYSLGPIPAGIAGAINGQVTLTAFDTAFLKLGRLMLIFAWMPIPMEKFAGISRRLDSWPIGAAKKEVQAIVQRWWRRRTISPRRQRILV